MPYRTEVVESGCRYVGVDWPASAHTKSPDVVSDLNSRLDLPAQSADVVFSISVQEHLEPQVMVAEAWRVLRLGGLFFLQVPFQWWVHQAPHDYFRFTRYGLEHLLRTAGFVNLEIEANRGFWTAAVLKWNYHSARWASAWPLKRWLMRG
jgi:SAM-dependent methyltransferase